MDIRYRKSQLLGTNKWETKELFPLALDELSNRDIYMLSSQCLFGFNKREIDSLRIVMHGSRERVNDLLLPKEFSFLLAKIYKRFSTINDPFVYVFLDTESFYYRPDKVCFQVKEPDGKKLKTKLIMICANCKRKLQAVISGPICDQRICSTCLSVRPVSAYYLYSEDCQKATSLLANNLRILEEEYLHWRNEATYGA